MKAVVLVGGFGTRLRPLTHQIPKQMLSVAGDTMLERVVRRLKGFGVTEVVLSLGYRPDVFLAAFPNGKVADVPVSYAVENEPLDTAGAIKFAASEGGIDSTFLVVNGDVICDFDIRQLLESHARNMGKATIALVPVDDPSAFGVVPTDDEGRVLAFIEKPKREEAPTNYINAGIYVLEPEALDSVELGQRVSIERVVFPALVEAGELFAEHFDGYWVDAGTIENFFKVSQDFRLRMVGDFFVQDELVGQIPQGYLVVGDSLIAKSARVSPEATVDRSVIGDNVVIERGAHIEHSIVMDEAIIAKFARVSESIIGCEVEVPSEAIVEERSVLASGCDLNSGERLSGQKIPN
ncbi:MAG: NDP-sugar synthase [Actinomycetota bacterium]|jgi:mannose-1-phosphate guanylyltransferase|nr:NDP-sugar synthase [Actinomycetota bacterium]